MSKQTLAQLVSTLQGKSMTYGWDAITLYDQRKANELLFQLYAARFNTDDGYIEPASMVANWGDGSYKEHIYNLKLSAPRLSFESSDPSLPAKARLTMDMIGGMIVSTKKNSGGAVFVSKMLKVVPVGGPQLWMDQPVTKGVVTGPGDVVIDISNADNFVANFVIGDLAMEEVGLRFKEYFSTLPPEVKRFSLGRLDGEQNGVLTPNNFEIRTMKSDPLAVMGDAQYGDGAVMMFITLKDGQDGNSFPNATSLYLIPADEGATKYTGTLLLSSRVLFEKIMREPAKANIGNGIDFLKYAPENGAGQDIAWNLRGSTDGITKDYAYHYKVRDDDFDAEFHTTLQAHFKLDEGGEALTIKGAGSSVDFVWNKKYTLPFSRTIHWAWPSGPETDNGNLDFVSNYSVKFDVSLNKETGVVSFDRNVDSSVYQLDMTGYDYLPDIGDVTTYLVPQIKEYFHPFVYEVLKELTPPAIDTFLIRNLLFPGHNALQLTDAFVPGDLAVFGQIDPLRTTTVLSPLNSTIEAGSKLNFTLTPMPDQVQWSVKDVDGNIDQPGQISATGEYTAPKAEDMPDGSAVVMVTATGTLNGLPVEGLALISILPSTIITNPMYTSCETGKTLTLSAEALDFAELQWTPLETEWGSTLTVDPDNSNNRIYTAGTKMDVAVPFPIDKFEIKNPKTGATTYISVMIEKTLVAAPMVLAASSDLPNGIAYFNLLGEEGPIVPVPGVITISWKILSGGGAVDAVTGKYTEPANITSGDFVVLSGTADISGVIKLHGQIAIPLPLGKYAEIIEDVNTSILSAHEEFWPSSRAQSSDQPK